jgi:hypothetical protein
MTTQPTPSWIARIAWALLLLMVGAAVAVWGLSRWEGGAEFFGVAPRPVATGSAPVRLVPTPAPVPTSQSVDAGRIAALVGRLAEI